MSTSFVAPSLDELAALLTAFDFELLIAQGGMGAVYRAQQRSLGRQVAIKVLPREMSGDPQFRESFQTEAKAMARLNHPNLIGVYDSGTADGMLYIVMEYVAGKSLYHSAYGKQVDPAQAVGIVRGICAGLGHAHENGIIHRDIKPANILLTPKVEPKIGDFGLARAMGGAEGGLVMGTPGYIAPELLTHPDRPDKRSDLYAVGVILYELLTGVRQTPDSLAPSRVCGCDAALDEIWRRATQPDPNRRYATAEAMIEALDQWSAAGARRPRGTTRPLLKVAASATPGAAVPHPTPTASSAPRYVQHEVGTNWPFIRNLFIIAGLICLIAVVWKQLERAKDARAREEVRIKEQQAAELARQKADAAERARLAEIGKKKPQPPPPVTEAPPPPVRSTETTAEALERLRFSLARGERVKMPPGTKTRAGNFYLVVPTPMTWSEGASYAEACGGHLATPKTSDDLAWLGTLVAGDQFAWLGAGRGGGNSWSLLDGSVWALEPAPKGPGVFVATGSFGVRTFDAMARHPFVIEWRSDGSNPITLELALQATGKSLSGSNPVYPPGTTTMDGRQYLFVAGPRQWADAGRLAERAGGHLAVISNAGEAPLLQEFIVRHPAAKGCWCGGMLDKGAWKWTTGEPWTFTKWAGGTPPSAMDMALAYVPGSGWEGRDRNTQCSGFVIEWSSDSKQKAATPAGPAGGASNAHIGSVVLVDKAREMVQASDRKRQQQFDENAKAFKWELDGLMRGLSRNEQAQWEPHIVALKMLVNNGRLPLKIPVRSGILLSNRMATICSHRAEKQEQINLAFIEEVTRIHQAYLPKLQAGITEATAQGKVELCEKLNDALKDATVDTKAWISSLGIDPTSGAPVISDEENAEGEKQPAP